MAKFDGIFEIQGTLKGMTFYKTKDGMLIRTKGGVSKDRIKNDPAFQRTRENGTEFAQYFFRTPQFVWGKGFARPFCICAGPAL